MGFTIFTQSGTFNPADYGLKAGDMLHIVCVGGGGGGGTGNVYTNAKVQATSGSASSFGSIITAKGGAAGVTPTSTSNNTISTAHRGQPTYEASSCLGGVGLYLTINNKEYLSCGAGGDGWLPNKEFRSSNLSSVFFLPAHIQSISSSTITGNASIQNGLTFFNDRELNYNSGNELVKYNAANRYKATSGIPMAHSSSLWCSSGVSAISAGGSGYGAGGAGAPGYTGYFNAYGFGSGGNSGEILHKDYKLTSTSSISVTVGSGGNGSYHTADTYNASYIWGAVALPVAQPSIGN